MKDTVDDKILWWALAFSLLGHAAMIKALFFADGDSALLWLIIGLLLYMRAREERIDANR